MVENVSKRVILIPNIDKMEEEKEYSQLLPRCEELYDKFIRPGQIRMTARREQGFRRLRYRHHISIYEFIHLCTFTPSYLSKILNRCKGKS